MVMVQSVGPYMPSMVLGVAWYLLVLVLLELLGSTHLVMQAGR